MEDYEDNRIGPVETSEPKSNFFSNAMDRLVLGMPPNVLQGGVYLVNTFVLNYHHGSEMSEVSEPSSDPDNPHNFPRMTS